MDKQTENIIIKVSKKFKEKIEKTSELYGLKIGPYIKMLITKNIKDNERKWFMIYILWIASIVITVLISKKIYLDWATEDFINLIEKKCNNCKYRKMKGND